MYEMTTTASRKLPCISFARSRLDGRIVEVYFGVQRYETIRYRPNQMTLITEIMDTAKRIYRNRIRRMYAESKTRHGCVYPFVKRRPVTETRKRKRVQKQKSFMKSRGSICSVELVLFVLLNGFRRIVLLRLLPPPPLPRARYRNKYRFRSRISVAIGGRIGHRRRRTCVSFVSVSKQCCSLCSRTRFS